MRHGDSRGKLSNRRYSERLHELGWYYVVRMADYQMNRPACLR